MDNLLAYGAPVALLYLACVRVLPFVVKFEDRSNISGARHLAMLTKELQCQSRK